MTFLALTLFFAALGEAATRAHGVLLAEQSVGDLVIAARRGDRDAYSELYKRYRGAAHSVALSVVSQDSAGDVVQEAFARALLKLKSLREPTRFGGWLMTIARNAALDVAKHRSRFRDGDAALERLQTHDPPRTEAARAIKAIQALPQAYREPLLMRLVEGMSGAEIAEKTGLTAGSVRVNLHRGMTMLRSKLEEPA